MVDSLLFDNQRESFFIQTRGSVLLPIIGMFFWPALGVAGYFLSPQAWCLVVLFFLLVLLPAGLVLFRHLLKKASIQSPFVTAYLLALAPVLMSICITVPVYFSDISLVPLCFVIGLALHWPVVGWLYNQAVYSIHTVLRTVGAVSIWWFSPEHLFTALPIFVGLLYLLTTLWIFAILHRLQNSAAQL